MFGGQFYSRVIKEDYEYYVEKHGPLKEIKLVGTVPLHWKAPNYQSLMVMTYGNKKIDFRIIWENDTIYETLTETEHPEGMVLFLAMNQEGKWGSYDFIKKISNVISFDYQRNTVKGLMLPPHDGISDYRQKLKRQ